VAQATKSHKKGSLSYRIPQNYQTRNRAAKPSTSMRSRDILLRMSRPLVVLLVVVACSKQESTHSENAPTVTLLPASASASAPTVAVSPRRACPKAPPAKPATAGSCTSDGDCKDGREGRCKDVYLGHGMSRAICTYDTCASDSDCEGKLCLCGASYEGRNACFAANCHDDADCPAGNKCADVPSTATGGLISSGRYCRTAKDTCTEHSCGDQKTCAFTATTGTWECVTSKYPPPG